MNKLKLAALGAFAGLALATTAQAAVITLDFEGVNDNYPDTNYSTVSNFYNGGTSGQGNTGTNFGVEFSENALAICLNTPGSRCSNTSRGDEGNPKSQRGGLFFLSGSQTFMNVVAGFTTGFSFFYTAPNNAGSISVFDGLNGTGNLLASLSLATTTSTCPSTYQANFCPFSIGSIGFGGTAMSVSFAGVANQIVFDDVTFGSLVPDPSPVPLPAGLPLLASALGAVAVLRRKRR